MAHTRTENRGPADGPGESAIGHAPGAGSEQGVLRARDGTRLSYRVFGDEACAEAVLLVPGWSEPALKYSEVARDLRLSGLRTYVLDHRGQGESGRLTSNPQVGHVQDFRQYVEDLAQFRRTVVAAAAHRRHFLLGHSMGGLVATLYLAAEPHGADALALSAPMFQIDTGRTPEWLALGVAGVLCALGRGMRYAPGQGDWTEARWRFEDNPLTRCRVRFERNMALLREHPELMVSGVSNRWLATAIAAARRAPGVAASIRAPVLLLQAGADSFVRPGRQDSFCAASPDCRILRFPEARHELLMELDEVRGPALAAILAHFRR